MKAATFPKDLISCYLSRISEKFGRCFPTVWTKLDFEMGSRIRKLKNIGNNFSGDSNDRFDSNIRDLFYFFKTPGLFSIELINMPALLQTNLTDVLFSI